MLYQIPSIEARCSIWSSFLELGAIYLNSTFHAALCLWSSKMLTCPIHFTQSSYFSKIEAFLVLNFLSEILSLFSGSSEFQRQPNQSNSNFHPFILRFRSHSKLFLERRPRFSTNQRVSSSFFSAFLNPCFFIHKYLELHFSKFENFQLWE